MFEHIAIAALILALIPSLMIAVNLLFFRAPGKNSARPESPVSVLIPARNEEKNIGTTIQGLLASHGIELEVVVMDDHSEDRTAKVVRDWQRQDPRVRLVAAPPLPAAWCGKQHACWRLASEARYDTLLFLDADVKVTSDAVERAVAELDASGAELVSGFPRQITATFGERLVIPLIHWILLGFLPIVAMRFSRHAAWSAGCGQLFVTRKKNYLAAGGHHAIRRSRHDGIKLPAAYRAAGMRTDIYDASRSATCRMYTNVEEIFRGFAKNAAEGMGSVAAIVPWTLLLFGSSVLPLVLIGTAAALGQSILIPTIALAAVLISRVVLAHRFRQPLDSALLHPLGIVIVLAIQWGALWNWFRGVSVGWKGRSNPHEKGVAG